MIQIPAALIVIGGYTIVVGITLTLSRDIEFSKEMVRDIHSFVP
tara:strand:+ start:965 stop:1096 length:132 start_codon:yes stop_codon:yes gene_type:complete